MSDPDYTRETSRATLATLPAAVQTAVRERIESSLLTIAEDAPVFVTTSRRRRRPGVFARMTGTGDPDREHTTTLVIGASDVIVVRAGEQYGTAVLSTRLTDVDVAGVSPLAAMAGGGDDGMSITGFPVSGTD